MATLDVAIGHTIARLKLQQQLRQMVHGGADVRQYAKTGPQSGAPLPVKASNSARRPASNVSRRNFMTRGTATPCKIQNFVWSSAAWPAPWRNDAPTCGARSVGPAANSFSRNVPSA